MSFRELRAGLLLVIGASLSAAAFFAIICAAWFLFGGIAALLCLAGLVAAIWFGVSALLIGERQSVEEEFCAPEGALPPREAA